MSLGPDTVRVVTTMKKADLDLVEEAASEMSLPVSTWIRVVAVREARRLKTEREKKEPSKG